MAKSVETDALKIYQDCVNAYKKLQAAKSEMNAIEMKTKKSSTLSAKDSERFNQLKEDSYAYEYYLKENLTMLRGLTEQSEEVKKNYDYHLKHGFKLLGTF